MTITLERVPAGGPAREELTALLPGYLRGLGVDAHYPYLPLYWTEAGRFPYLIREQGRTAGFALVRQLPDSGAFEMAEFCVLPDFRARGLGAQAARALFAAHRAPGASASWQQRRRAALLAHGRAAGGRAAAARSRWRTDSGCCPCPARLRPARPTRPRRPRMRSKSAWRRRRTRQPSSRSTPWPWRIPRAPGRSRGPSNRTMPGRGRRRPHRGLCDAGPRLFRTRLCIAHRRRRRLPAPGRGAAPAASGRDRLRYSRFSRRPTSPMSPPGA